MNRILFSVFVGALGCAVLIALGVWQMQRLQWKEGILAEIDARMAQTPIELPAEPTEEADEYLPVRVEGTFLGGALHVLTSIKDKGPGFRVIEPFETADGRTILVDRGFLPVEAKVEPVSTPSLVLTGNLLWPNEIDSFTPEPDFAQNMWFVRDIPYMAQVTEAEPLLIVADLTTDPLIQPLPINAAEIPNDHLNYAITWFLLAAVWAGMTLFWIIRTRRRLPL